VPVSAIATAAPVITPSTASSATGRGSRRRRCQHPWADRPRRGRGHDDPACAALPQRFSNRGHDLAGLPCAGPCSRSRATARPAGRAAVRCPDRRWSGSRVATESPGGAWLPGAELSGAELSGAELSGAELVRAGLPARCGSGPGPPRVRPGRSRPVPVFLPATHSRKVWRGGSGASRAAVHADSGGGSRRMRPPRPSTRPSRLAPCAAAHRAGLAIPGGGGHGDRLRGWAPGGPGPSPRRDERADGPGARNVDLHRAGVIARPHSDDAYGRDALSSTPVSCGDSTAPIGPGYTEP